MGGGKSSPEYLDEKRTITNNIKAEKFENINNTNNNKYFFILFVLTILYLFIFYKYKNRYKD